MKFFLTAFLLCLFVNSCAAFEKTGELRKIDLYQLGGEEFVFKIYGENLPEPFLKIAPDNVLNITLTNTKILNPENINNQKQAISQLESLISNLQIHENSSGIVIKISAFHKLTLHSKRISPQASTLRLKIQPDDENNFDKNFLTKSEQNFNALKNTLTFNDDKIITFNLYDVPLSASLRLIGEEAGYNVFLDSSIPNENVSASLKNIRADTAFNNLMKIYNIVCYQVDKSTIAFGTRDGLYKLSGTDLTKAFKIFYATPADIKNAVMNLLNIPEKNIVIDARTNTFYIKTNPAKMSEAEILLNQLDQPAKQIMIHASIFEFNDSATTDIENGINAIYEHWRLDFNNGAGSLIYNNNKFRSYENVTRQIENTFTLLERNGKGKLLANPSVIAIDGGSANISLTEKYPYVADRDDNGNVEWREKTVGPELIFTPHVGREDYINLELTIKTGEIIGLATGSNGEVMPRTSDRSVNTNIRVRDGMPFIIGGLFRDNKNTTNQKFPILGDIPLIGGLFKYKYDEHNKTQVVILITPYILD